MRHDDDVPVIEDALPADSWAEEPPAYIRAGESNWLAQKVAEFETRGGRVQHIPNGVTSGFEDTDMVVRGTGEHNKRCRKPTKGRKDDEHNRGSGERPQDAGRARPELLAQWRQDPRD